jgi:glycosyltransferase involved in cell wall biosynthesis
MLPGGTAMTSLSFDITIPVLNEEGRLRAGVDTLVRFLAQEGLDDRCRITIADNGSTDRTAEVAAELLSKYANVGYLSVGKRGVGLALKTAWGQSRADIVGYMDVDLATDIQHFKQVVQGFETGTAALVNGSRNLPGSRVINRSRVRDLSSWGFNTLLRLMLRVKFTDGMCGFKFLRRSVYDQVARVGIRNDGWFFCTEILYIAERLGHKIEELAVTWTDDRESRVRLVRLSLYYLREMNHLRRRQIGEKAA